MFKNPLRKIGLSANACYLQLRCLNERIHFRRKLAEAEETAAKFDDLKATKVFNLTRTNFSNKTESMGSARSRSFS